MSEDAGFERQMLNRMSSLIDGMKTLTTRLGSTVETMGRYDAEFLKLTRLGNAVRQDIAESRSDVAQLRAEMNARLDALFRKVDAAESAIDASASDIQRLSAEMSSQFNLILNSLQDNLNSQLSNKDLTDRLEELERRLGM